MNDAQWLRDWCSKHGRATVYEDRKEAEVLAVLAEGDAKDEHKSIKKALEEEGYGGSLTDYMLDVLNERVHDEVDRLVSKDD